MSSGKFRLVSTLVSLTPTKPPGVYFIKGYITERDSLTVRMLACHAADPGSNPARGDDFFN